MKEFFYCWTDLNNLIRRVHFSFVLGCRVLFGVSYGYWEISRKSFECLGNIQLDGFRALRSEVAVGNLPEKIRMWSRFCFSRSLLWLTVDFFSSRLKGFCTQQFCLISICQGCPARYFLEETFWWLQRGALKINPIHHPKTPEDPGKSTRKPA